jgi:hypothetical protein
MVVEDEKESHLQERGDSSMLAPQGQRRNFSFLQLKYIQECTKKETKYFSFRDLDRDIEEYFKEEENH